MLVKVFRAMFTVVSRHFLHMFVFLVVLWSFWGAYFWSVLFLFVCCCCFLILSVLLRFISFFPHRPFGGVAKKWLFHVHSSKGVFGVSGFTVSLPKTTIFTWGLMPSPVLGGGGAQSQTTIVNRKK